MPRCCTGPATVWEIPNYSRYVVSRLLLWTGKKKDALQAEAVYLGRASSSFSAGTVFLSLLVSARRLLSPGNLIELDIPGAKSVPFC